MTSSTMLALVLVFAAVMDLLAVRFLKQVFTQNGKMSEAEKRTIILVLNASSWLFFLGGVAVYYFQPLD